MMSTTITVSVRGVEHLARPESPGSNALVVDMACPHCGARPLRVQGTNEPPARARDYFRGDGKTVCCERPIDWIQARWVDPDAPESVAKIRNDVAPSLERGRLAVSERRWAEAAALYELVAQAYRSARLFDEADNWDRRARDCRELADRDEKKARTMR